MSMDLSWEWKKTSQAGNFLFWSTLITVWMADFAYLNSGSQFQQHRTGDTSCPKLLLVFSVV